LILQPPEFADKPNIANGPLPAVPVLIDNPQTDAKINLGRQLYFDGRLSSDGTISCASSHQPEKAWADTTPTSAGVGHKMGGRNSPSVINEAYSVPQFWDGRAVHLEKQAVGPVQNPIEMDLTKEQLEFRLNHIPGYVTEFQQVFGEDPTIDLMAKAIASFERTVISSDTPYDRYLDGDRTAMSPAAVRGLRTFNGKGHCTVCHSGPNFSDSAYHNLGIGYENGKYKDVGRYDVTKNPRDMGAFKTPMLRNVADTPPYLHDGSERTLMDVVNLYNRGSIANPHLDLAMMPLNLTSSEKRDLVAFLQALSGPYPVVAAPPLPNPEITAQQLTAMMEGGAQ
jgi:cytochrome c peroxidase